MCIGRGQEEKGVEQNWQSFLPNNELHLRLVHLCAWSFPALAEEPSPVLTPYFFSLLLNNDRITSFPTWHFRGIIFSVLDSGSCLPHVHLRSSLFSFVWRHSILAFEWKEQSPVPELKSSLYHHSRLITHKRCGEDHIVMSCRERQQRLHVSLIMLMFGRVHLELGLEKYAVAGSRKGRGSPRYCCDVMPCGHRWHHGMVLQLHYGGFLVDNC